MCSGVKQEVYDFQASLVMSSHMGPPKTENNLCVCVATWDANLEESEPFVVIEHHLEALVVDDGEEASISKIINSLR